MALLAGSACTWVRSKAVIKTERSDQETRPCAERSEQAKRTKPFVALGLFSLHEEDLSKKIQWGHPSSLVVLHTFHDTCKTSASNSSKPSNYGQCSFDKRTFRCRLISPRWLSCAIITSNFISQGGTSAKWIVDVEIKKLRDGILFIFKKTKIVLFPA